MDAIRRIWNNRKGDLRRLWNWAKRGTHPRRWQRLAQWAKRKREEARHDHRINRAKFWAKKQTIYRRKWRRAKKHLAETGEAKWDDWMANGHSLNITAAVKQEAAIAVVEFGCTVTSTYRAVVIPQSNPNSYHGPNVSPGKAVDVAGGGMDDYQRDCFVRREGDPSLLELFGPINELGLKNGHAVTLGEGTFLENLHDTHTHVAAG